MELKLAYQCHIAIAFSLKLPFIVPVMVTVTDGGLQHAGENYMLTCNVNGGQAGRETTYRWLNNNVYVSGETSATLSFTPLRQTTPSSNGQYVCEVMRSGRTVGSEGFTIMVAGKNDG